MCFGCFGLCVLFSYDTLDGLPAVFQQYLWWFFVLYHKLRDTSSVVTKLRGRFNGMYVPGIRISTQLAKMSFRLNLRSHSCSVLYFFSSIPGMYSVSHTHSIRA